MIFSDADEFTKYKKVTLYNILPNYIDGKWYWMKKVTAVKRSFLVHGRLDGCNRDIWHHKYVKVLSKLEQIL